MVSQGSSVFMSTTNVKQNRMGTDDIIQRGKIQAGKS